MARKPIVGGNWKCNPGKMADVEALLGAWKSVDKDKCDVVICPTALHLGFVKEKIEALNMMVATQNVSKTGMGAFTGEWSAEHLKDMNVAWTLIGHSERRSKYGETDEETAVKVEKCQEAGIKVIFCIGELLEEREGGKTDAVNQRQLAAVIPKVKNWDDIVIAYEPVWAIGTGKVATPEQAEETHAAIRKYMETAVSAEVAAKIRIQYGGSVSPDNCADLISKPNIDGFLVGGASLKPSFMDVITKSG
uniref:Triosephosphate isomerase n=1 Tax=Alexandrium catenella TaxID=2925 RepID=A0A7S1PM74_ALECA|mmetsp:Transcript_103713/g.275962  ORF Transcript_103713/g.275962 Transcript_103713/m.275962 type:complete len:249 (+) Transcript_103713:78-824(+)|eukprot:CAMPEP_0171172286 /NCGR_PEP_ID=MMETSP0790-20130122/9644_1 /TAXON_ID=2925 /ORGANISM="Alexandrium catenella, Strain OF101" /LENGTH=248 /DNA_ID=CAMNT_0011637145 /DNA_START=75 /DNA_END=821 /DNA_ORIENTATION=+